MTFRSVFVDQGGNNLEAWAVGDAIAGSAADLAFLLRSSGKLERSSKPRRNYAEPGKCILGEHDGGLGVRQLAV